jgi:transposase-like protein
MAVGGSVVQYARWTNLQCVQHFAKVRWGSFKLVTCPHCQTRDEHYWHVKELRWKCCSCGKRFAVTSNTVLANHRLSLQNILACIFLWAAGAAGKPSLELRRMLGIRSYNAVFALDAKLREAIRRGYATGLLSGVVEMDGAHASGRRASEKRGRPLPTRVTPEEETLKQAVMSKKERAEHRANMRAAAASGRTFDSEFGYLYPDSRRIVLTIRQRGNKRGKGAISTRVTDGMAETPDVVQAFVDKYVAAPETVLATDSGSA